MPNAEHENLVLRENAANFFNWISDAKERRREEEAELQTNKVDAKTHTTKGDKAA